ncbi:hypothetical protein AMELA_G00025050, partial [Ameiurus melas]
EGFCVEKDRFWTGPTGPFSRSPSLVNDHGLLCADSIITYILRRERELQQIKVRDLIISVFPNYTVKIARARATFNEVQRQLCGIEGARYGILHPARLRITYNGVQKDFISAEEAGDYVKLSITGVEGPTSALSGRLWRSWLSGLSTNRRVGGSIPGPGDSTY